MHDTHWLDILERAVNSAEARQALDEHMAIHTRARGYQRCPTCGEWAGVLPIEVDAGDDPCLRCVAGIVVQSCEDCERLHEQFEAACLPNYE